MVSYHVLLIGMEDSTCERWPVCPRGRGLYTDRPLAGSPLAVTRCHGGVVLLLLLRTSSRALLIFLDWEVVFLKNMPYGDQDDLWGKNNIRARRSPRYVSRLLNLAGVPDK